MDNHSADLTDEFSFILKPSNIPLAGIGVFTTHAINQGIKIRLSPQDSQFRRLQRSEIPELFHRYCIAEKDGWYICPRQFNAIEIGWYLNHSFTPNLEGRDDGWYTLRKIAAGEELLIDYNTFNEPEAEKESYYKAR